MKYCNQTLILGVDIAKYKHLERAQDFRENQINIDNWVPADKTGYNTVKHFWKIEP